MAIPFLDTNILLRHLLQDHPDHSPRATAYLERIERGEVQAHIAETVIFETVFLLQHRFGEPKARVVELIQPLIEMAGIRLPGKRKMRRVFDLYLRLNLPFADAYHAVLMRQLGLSEIVTFDQDFDRVPGIRGVEPR